MLLRKTKILCNQCHGASEVVVPVASDEADLSPQSLTCARPGHDLGGRRVGLTRSDVTVVETRHEEQSASASFGYGTPTGMKAEKQPDMAGWDGEIKRRAEEIEAARPQHTPEQVQMAKDVTKCTTAGYPRPDA